MGSMSSLPYLNGASSATDEAALILEQLIRFPTYETESDATLYCQKLLAEAGYHTQLVYASEDHEKRHPNLVAWIPGEGDPDDALLIYGHLDTLPPDSRKWDRNDPHEPTLVNGRLYGLGAVSNKGQIAATVAALCEMARTGKRPARHVRLALFAEETGRRPGSKLLVEKHRELFDGCTDGIGLEYGGFSQTVGGRRLYIIQSGEKSDSHAIITLEGDATSTALINKSPVLEAAGHLEAAISRHTRLGLWEREIDPEFLATVERFAFTPEEREQLDVLLGPATQHVIQPTHREQAESSLGLIPGTVKLYVSIRALPGQEGSARRQLEKLVQAQEEKWRQDGLEGVALRIKFKGLNGYSVASRGRSHAALADAILAQDPQAEIFRMYMIFGGDGKHLLLLDLESLAAGTPQRFPQDLNILSLMNSPHECMPLSTLSFATTGMMHLLEHARTRKEAGKGTRHSVTKRAPRKIPRLHGKGRPLDELRTATSFLRPSPYEEAPEIGRGLEDLVVSMDHETNLSNDYKPDAIALITNNGRVPSYAVEAALEFDIPLRIYSNPDPMPTETLHDLRAVPRLKLQVFHVNNKRILLNPEMRMFNMELGPFARERYTNVALARNIAVLHACAAGEESLLFLDDDSQPRPEDIRALPTDLFVRGPRIQRKAVALKVAGQLDTDTLNRLKCHMRRFQRAQDYPTLDDGKQQGLMIGAGNLLLNAQEFDGPSPLGYYNQDLASLAPALAEHNGVAHHGGSIQDYNPNYTTSRVKQEEPGDLLWNIIRYSLRESRVPPYADPELILEVYHQRQEHHRLLREEICRTVDIAHNRGNIASKKFFEGCHELLSAAEGVLKLISPEDCSTALQTMHNMQQEYALLRLRLAGRYTIDEFAKRYNITHRDPRPQPQVRPIGQGRGRNPYPVSHR